MRLGWNDLKLTALVSVLGLSVWATGCGEPATPVAPISSVGAQAGSTTGGGVDVPMADPATTDSATTAPDATKPEGDKPEADKTVDAKESEASKTDDAPKESADKKEEKKEE
jgi:hypothetical protein